MEEKRAVLYPKNLKICGIVRILSGIALEKVRTLCVLAYVAVNKLGTDSRVWEDVENAFLKRIPFEANRSIWGEVFFE
jgi:hypothetical protein